MTKLIDCPICGETKPVRDDAKVCSSNCRVKAWRKRKKENETIGAMSVPDEVFYKLPFSVINTKED